MVRCHLCGTYVKANRLEVHLKRKHKNYYMSPASYVFQQHKTKYGKEKAKFLVGSLFEKKRKML